VSINNDGTTSILVNGNIQLPVGGKILDGVGNIIISADALSGVGLSTPFVAVPLNPLWNGLTGSPGGYPQIAASACASEIQIWNGIIPMLAWPQIRFNMTTGRALGTVSVPTYRFYINGVLVDTLTDATIRNYSNKIFTLPPFSVLGLAFGVSPVGVSITIQASVSNTDTFAAGALAWMAGN
jgi:hypothetical protein